MNELLIRLFDLLIIAVWCLCAWLCWRFDLWAVPEQKTVDGLYMINRNSMEFMRTQL